MQINEMTTDQLRALLEQVSALIQTRRAEEVADQQDRQERIMAAVGTLTTLLGEEGTEPNQDSIRGVMAYTDEDIAAHPVLAFRLILAGLDILTNTMLDVAKVVGE